MTVHWKAVEQSFTCTVVLFGFQFYPVCSFINLGLGTVRTERVNNTVYESVMLAKWPCSCTVQQLLNIILYFIMCKYNYKFL